MLVIKGSATCARVFGNIIEDEAVAQIRELCDQPYMKDVVVRVMPDVHAGKGCTIGTTMVLKDAVAPSLVGVDIGCGVEAYRFQADELELERLDDIIYKTIPSGFKIRKRPHPWVGEHVLPLLSRLHCRKSVDLDRAAHSIGTLGGGNHFIEVNRSALEGCYYLVVHTGSRHLGTQVAGHYQETACNAMSSSLEDRELIVRDKKKGKKIAGRSGEIEACIRAMKDRPTRRELVPLLGRDYQRYIHDMAITQQFAAWNRRAIATAILDAMGWKAGAVIRSVHNYIDTRSGILRKGAISAARDEMLIIPINMAEGSLIGRGKGHPDWNYSAPHGAGRLMSRKRARSSLSLEEMQLNMSGIYTTSVNRGTLDEAPGAYKPISAIVDCIGDSVEILEQIRPVYNFKASGS